MSNPVDQKRRVMLIGMATLPVSGLAATVMTPPASEGPFYPTTAMRFDDVDNDLVKVAGVVERAGGEIVQLTGRVLDSAARPVAGARVEIWQCDANGRYLHSGDRGSVARDAGFQGYGHDLSADDGSYLFRTIKPVPYPGRTPHIHVKVLIGGRERLTTQFYLPDHPDNERDWLYRRVPEEMREKVTLQFRQGGDYPVANLDIVV